MGEFLYYSLYSSALSYYRLEGNSNDAIGGINGTDTSISYSTSYGKFGQGANFGAGTARISLGNNYTLTAASTKSFNVWFKSTATDAAYQAILAKGNYTDTGYMIMMYASGDGTHPNQVLFTIGTGTVYSSALAGDGLWHLASLVCDGPNTKGRGYIDGVQIGSDFTPTFGTNNSLLGIGNQYDITGAAWLSRAFTQGYVDDVSVVNKVQSTAECYNLYVARSGLVGIL